MTVQFLNGLPFFSDHTKYRNARKSPDLYEEEYLLNPDGLIQKHDIPGISC
jgi:hypothetical protein